jgi:hypothetical protein
LRATRADRQGLNTFGHAAAEERHTVEHVEMFGLGRSYAIEARITVRDGGAEGVLVANADFIGGFVLWVDAQQRLHHTWAKPG